MRKLKKRLGKEAKVMVMKLLKQCSVIVEKELWNVQGIVSQDREHLKVIPMER